jgi:hypothetical protein
MFKSDFSFFCCVLHSSCFFVAIFGHGACLITAVEWLIQYILHELLWSNSVKLVKAIEHAKVMVALQEHQ